MARVYLMIEDVESAEEVISLHFAIDMGNGEEPLPVTIDDMTPAQEMGWNFYNVGIATLDADRKAAMKAEMEGPQILVPAHMAGKKRG